MIQEIIGEVQKDFTAQTGNRIEAHYKEGKGVLFIYEGERLLPHNVILALSENQLRKIRVSSFIF